MNTPTEEQLEEGKRSIKFRQSKFADLRKKEKERAEEERQRYLDEKNEERKKKKERMKTLKLERVPVTKNRMKPVYKSVFQEYFPPTSESDDDLFSGDYNDGNVKGCYPFDPLEGGKRKTRKNKRKGTKKNKKNKVKKSKKRIHKKKSLYNRKKK